MKNLFAERSLRECLSQVETDLQREVDSLNHEYLLKVGEADLEEHLVAKYSLEPPRVLVGEVYQDEPDDIQIEIGRHPERAIWSHSRLARIPGTAITVSIPFTGNADLLRCQPSTFTANPPPGKIVGCEIQITYESAGQDGEDLRRMYDRDSETIQEYVSWVRKDVESFNQSLLERSRQAIRRRKKKLLADRDMSAALGIPMKRRSDAPQTYVASEVRRKATIERPTVPTEEPFRPEPTLADVEYEHILQVIQSMVAVMERSPQAFADMSEEDLRSHFLVQLNGHYEGQATGETFNFTGKTDILIRVKGKNIFIAECKFWQGPKSLVRTVDQLLGYASWRDTKTAVLLFNRKVRFSTVLDRIPDTVSNHPCFKREASVTGETVFRYILHQPADTNRELVLTVLAFDVPG